MKYLLILYVCSYATAEMKCNNESITGSFDKTCKLWNAETGALYHTFRGHATEIVCLSFNPCFIVA